MQHVDDDLMYWLLASLGQAQPNVNKDGEIQPFDLGYQKDQANFLQDQSDLLSDPTMAAMFSLNSFDPGAFAPVEDEVIEYDLPQRPLLDAYLGSQPGSLEFGIAQAIEGGFSPETAIAQARELGAIDGVDIDAEKRARELANTLFQERATYNAEAAKIPRDEQGNFIRREVTYKDSPAAEMFRSQGKPLPTDRWQEEDFAPGITADRQKYDTAISEQRAAFEALKAAEKSLKGGELLFGAIDNNRPDRTPSVSQSPPIEAAIDPDTQRRRLDYYNQGRQLEGQEPFPDDALLSPNGTRVDDIIGAGKSEMPNEMRRRMAAIGGPEELRRRAGGQPAPAEPQGRGALGWIEDARMSRLQAQVDQARKAHEASQQKSAREMSGRRLHDQAYASMKTKLAEKNGDTPLRRVMLARMQGLNSRGL